MLSFSSFKIRVLTHRQRATFSAVHPVRLDQACNIRLDIRFCPVVVFRVRKKVSRCSRTNPMMVTTNVLALRSSLHVLRYFESVLRIVDESRTLWRPFTPFSSRGSQRVVNRVFRLSWNFPTSNRREKTSGFQQIVQM